MLLNFKLGLGDTELVAISVYFMYTVFKILKASRPMALTVLRPQGFKLVKQFFFFPDSCTANLLSYVNCHKTFV